MTEQTDTATTPVKAPQSATPADPKAEPKQARQRIPWWASHPPTLITVGLVVVAVELIGYQGAGPMRWLIGNAVAVVLILVAVAVLRRKAATRARVTAARGRTSAGTSRGPVAGGSPRGAGRSGMFGGGRRGGSAGSSGSSGGASGAGGRRGLLGRLTGRGKPAAGASAGGAAPAGRGASGSARRGLFGGRPGGSRGAGSGSSGGHGSSGGAGSRGRGLFGRRGATSSGHGSTGGGSGRGGSGPSGARSLWPFKRPSGGGAASPAKASRPGASSPATGKTQPSRWNPWNWKFGKAAAHDPAAKTSNGADTAPQKSADTKTQATGGQDVTAAAKPTRPTPHRAAAPVAVPTPAKHVHASTGRNQAMGIQHTDDASLQRWGRSLSHFAPALGELAKKHDATVADDEATAAAIAKIAQQGDSDQPASARLTSELEAIAAEQKKIAAEAAALAGRRRALASRAETLPAMYRQEHETDEDRMNAPRKSRQAEKRADVATAEQDT